jgi:hypothetical protein
VNNAKQIEPVQAKNKRPAKPMRISFDLDDTLILKSVEGPCEELLPPRRRGEAIEERLRQGTRELLSAVIKG